MVAAAREDSGAAGEGAGARGPAGARPGVRAAVGEGRCIHAPALRQSPTATATVAASAGGSGGGGSSSSPAIAKECGGFA